MDFAFYVKQEKQYNFIFRFTDAANDLDKEYRFGLKSAEKLIDVCKKIKQVIETSYQRRKENNKNEENSLKDSNFNVNAKFFKNGRNINNITCKQLNENDENIQFIINNKKYTVLINKPRIISVELPKCIFVDYPIYPSDFNAIFYVKSKSIFTWHKSIDKQNWSEIATSFSYTPTNQDVNYYLKFGCIPGNEKNSGILYEVVSTVPVTVFKDKCPFERRHTYTQNKLSGKRLRVLTYNLLAEHYCKSESAKAAYHYCPPEVLSMDYRKQLLLKEIAGYNADIICLQEVDYKLFKTMLKTELSKRKYSGVYCPKERKPEGLACFYNEKRFKYVTKKYIIIGKEIINNPRLANFWKSIQANEAATIRLIDQNTILQLVELKSIENDEILYVANTHLYFHPDAAHIRLLQAAACQIYICNLMNKISKEKSRKSLIFCGDFNSTPESGVFRFFTDGYISKNSPEWTKNEDEIVKNVQLRNKIIMESACGTPEYTNYTETFKGCLDYIFYEKLKLKVNKIIPLLTTEEINVNLGLPNIGIPSDHIALVADLEWT